MLTDFHSHILPGIDDGSDGVATSLELLRRERAQGIDRVAATPHFYPRYESPERFLERRAQAEARLREAMADTPGLPQLLVGAEVYYFRGISESEWLPELTLRGTGAVLLEMPPAPWTDAMYQEMEDLWTKRGITPIIAHVDRYIGPLRSHGIPQTLAQLPVLVQANASFFLHRGTAAMALRMLKQDRIHLLGSDCHNLTDRAPNLGAALDRIERKLGAEPLERLRAWENTVLSNQ